MPWVAQVGTVMSLSGTCQLTIQNTSANPGASTITWSVYLSSNDKVLDAGDVLLQQGTIAGLPGSGSTVVNFGANTWPASGWSGYLIATVHATDDSNPINDIVVSPHGCAVADTLVNEPGGNNNGNGPNPPIGQTSNTGVVNLAANQSFVISGVMDAAGNYDTYRFSSAASLTKFNIRCFWATGYDDIDLHLWDTGATDLVAVDAGIDSEPAVSAWTVTGATPRTWYVSAYMFLAGGTAPDAGQPYILFVKGLP